ncbi:MAG: ATP-binding protein [Verrucomicrobia bacterium]|nr:ATP-binding protein [Verrucomicrobiota bacterium]
MTPMRRHYVTARRSRAAVCALARRGQPARPLLAAAHPRQAPRRSLRVRLGPDVEHVARACDRVRTFLSANGLAEREVNAWECVLVEALNNAIEHGATTGRSRGAGLSVVVRPACVVAEVTDRGPGFEWPQAVALPPAHSERGRGLFIIRSLTDRARYVREGTRNRLVLERHLPPALRAGKPVRS